MIAAVDPDQPDDVQSSGRSNAYYAALRDAGITVDWGGGQGADAMANLLSQPEPPTAVYAYSDEVALGAIRTLRRAGLRIPDDLSVIGIDDYPVAELTDLTTVRQPVREQGELAGRMLLSILSVEEAERDVVVPTQLVIRGSTAPPRG
jgi:DNA-binding LacI/PurR family transcriptional regulator